MQFFHYDPECCNSHYRILNICKNPLPRSCEFRNRSNQNMWMYGEVADFIPAEYQFRLAETLFESLFISRLFSSNN